MPQPEPLHQLQELLLRLFQLDLSDFDCEVLTDAGPERRAVVLWRDMEGPDAEAESRFPEPRIRGADPGYDEVCINGDSAVPGMYSLDPAFKRLIEEEEKP